jgi:hypothetical protein
MKLVKYAPDVKDYDGCLFLATPYFLAPSSGFKTEETTGRKLTGNTTDGGDCGGLYFRNILTGTTDGMHDGSYGDNRGNRFIPSSVLALFIASISSKN